MSNMVLKKTFNFSVNSIEVYRTLIAKSEYVLSKQFLRAATSIGANVREAQRAQSKKDFLSKINIALKEADETLYWIELLYATNYLDKREFDFCVWYKDNCINPCNSWFNFYVCCCFCGCGCNNIMYFKYS